MGKIYRVVRYFDGYPENTICKCETIEEARLKRDEYNKKNNRPYTDYHILVDGDEEFGFKTYRTE